MATWKELKDLIGSHPDEDLDYTDLINDLESPSDSESFSDETILQKSDAVERIKERASAYLKQSTKIIDKKRRDSDKFFTLTLVVGSVGLLLFTIGVILFLLGPMQAAALSSLIGLISEFLAGVIFVKDKHLREQIEKEQKRLDKNQHILTLFDHAETIEDINTKDQAKMLIIKEVLNQSKNK